ncbi:hypothetical protein RN001_003167 [Aquatica leii]|uniref:Uncharacterized protein n=1 Tax=Aquatica leii TaxID=1421715 RepID=A0AAN7PQS5_9COLE|nr:hypothetical protein RN001_003167 [Aquatica leii]
MREDKAEELYFSYVECDSNPLIGYGQGAVKPLGLFTALLNIDGVEAKVKVHVVPNESQDVTLIMGYPFTEQEHVLIISRADKLEIKNVSEDPETSESFENIQGSVSNSSTSNQKHDIGFENFQSRLNRTSNRTPTRLVTTTPSYRTVKPKNTSPTKPSKPHGTSPPERPPATTMKPSKPKVTSRPQVPRNTTIKPTVSKITTHKPLKPKFTTTTTPKPTRPTLPPSVYVKPNIEKVIIPPINSVKWEYTPPWQPNVVTTTPSWIHTNVSQPSEPNQNYKDLDFGLFLMHLHDFTRKAEHNHQIKYKRYNGDSFSYYYEISNYYNNGHLAAKYYRVPVELLKNCQANTTNVMCLPNTNAICLTNGTIMCVTHLSATTPCENHTAYCAITYVPCDGRYQSCIGSQEPLYIGTIDCTHVKIQSPGGEDAEIFRNRKGRQWVSIEELPNDPIPKSNNSRTS